MTREERVGWGWEAHQLCQQILFISCQLRLFWDTAKGWLPIFSLQDTPLPAPALPYPLLLAKGQAFWGAGSREPFKCADRQNPGLETVFPEPTLHCAQHQGSLLLCAEMQERCLLLDPWSGTQALPVPPGGQRRELFSPTGPGRDGTLREIWSWVW